MFSRFKRFVNTQKIRKTAFRILCVFTAVFLVTTEYIDKNAIVVGAWDISDWMTPSNPDWQNYGFSSESEYDKAINHGFMLQGAKACNSRFPWTKNCKPIYQVDGYSSQSELETAVDSGKYMDGFGNITTTPPNLCYGTGDISGETEEAIGVASELSGVKFKSGKNLSDFAVSLVKDMDKDLDNVKSDISKEVQDRFGETGQQIKADIASGRKDWNQILTVMKNGWIALTPAALLGLSGFLSMFAGKNISQQTNKSIGEGTIPLSSFKEMIDQNGNPVTTNGKQGYYIDQIVKSAIDKNGSYEVDTWYDSDQEVDCTINATRSNKNQNSLVIRTSDRYITYLNGDIDPPGLQRDFPLDVDVSWIVWGSIYNGGTVSMKLYQGVDTVLGDATTVQPGAPSQNTAYPDTWTNGQPGFCIDTSKSHDVSDILNNTPSNIDQNKKVPISTPTGANTPITSGGTSTGTDPSDNFGAPTTGLNFKPLEMALSTKFPFCIPWDIVNAVKSIFVTSQKPVLKITLPMGQIGDYVAGLNHSSSPLQDYTFDLDFTKYQILIDSIKFILSLWWTWFLIVKTRDLIRG